MYKNIINYIFLFSLITLGWLPSLHSSNLCTNLFETRTNPIINNIDENNTLVFLRSNPKWSWDWLYKKIFNSNNKILIKTLDFIGIVGGDIKPDNVEIVKQKNGNYEIGITDLDDSGTGQLFIDFVHTLIYNAEWPFKIKKKEVIELYLNGLNGVEMKFKHKLSEIDRYFQKIKSENDKKNKNRTINLFDKNLSEEKFYKYLKLKSLEDSSKEAQEIYAEASNDILKALESYGKIIHFGVRVKNKGGSMKLPRFSYLTDINEEALLVIEVKLQSKDPAVRYGHHVQGSARDRILEVLKNYRPQNSESSILEVIKTDGNHEFIIRLKTEPVVDLEYVMKDDEEAIEYYQDFLRQMYYWQGQIHRSQSKRYIKFWSENREFLSDSAIQLMYEHIEDAKNMNNKP